MDADGSPALLSDPHRRRAAHLYGLIISGAVLATAPDDFRLARIAVLLLGTLCIYWLAETYVHWMAARALRRRDLTGPERRAIVVDGWPLVAASAVPLAALALEAVLGIETKTALDITLAVNAAHALRHRLADGQGQWALGGASWCSPRASPACWVSR